MKTLHFVSKHHSTWGLITYGVSAAAACSVSSRQSCQVSCVSQIKRVPPWCHACLHSTVCRCRAAPQAGDCQYFQKIAVLTELLCCSLLAVCCRFQQKSSPAWPTTMPGPGAIRLDKRSPDCRTTRLLLAETPPQPMLQMLMVRALTDCCLCCLASCRQTLLF